MPSHELVISRQNNPIIALGMTGASFDSAQRAGVTHIEADTDAMLYIAREVGYTAPTEELWPLVLVTRDSSDTRSLIGRWDERLPVNQSSPQANRFFTANHLSADMPPSGNRDAFVRYAKEIGAPALTEVSIASWKEGHSHVGDFATGPLLGQRPLDLPPKPSGLSLARRAIQGAFGDDAKSLRIINNIRKRQDLPEPFIISRRPSSPALEGRSQIER